jgi:Baseplate J-like protein.
MALIDLSTLIVSATADAVLDLLVDLCAGVGLDTETWAEGDPTLSELDAVSRMVEADEQVIVDAIKSGFVSLAEKEGLTLAARYLRNCLREEAVPATCTLRLTNAGAQPYEFEPGDITARNSTTKVTYRSTNTTNVALDGGGTLDVEIVCEVDGIAGNSGVGDIDELVNALPQVTVTNTTAAVGVEAESDDALRIRADAKLGSLSPNGPGLAYEYVARTRSLNGNVAVTRTRRISDSDTGVVTMYIAGADGALTSPEVATVDAALEQWAVPACIDLDLQNSTNQVIAITYELWVYDSIALTSAAIQSAVEAYLLERFATLAIGGDTDAPPTPGKVYHEWLRAQILAAVFPYGYRCAVTVPAGDTTATSIGHVPTLGAVTCTAINLVTAPSL